MTAPGKIKATPSALLQSGIETCEFRSQSVSLAEINPISIVRIDALPGSSVNGLPEISGACIDGDSTTLCLRPEEWLVVSETLTSEDLLLRAQSQFESDLVFASDNSDGLAVFRVEGSGAAWLLSKLSGLDFIAGQAGAEHCAQTLMLNLDVLVHYRPGKDGGAIFDLFFDRSLARYFWELLIASTPHADYLAEAF